MLAVIEHEQQSLPTHMLNECLSTFPGLAERECHGSLHDTRPSSKGC
jgi:hypothetical protein